MGDKITKDGHTMFTQDVGKDLNRLAYVEELAEERGKEIETLKFYADKCDSQHEELKAKDKEIEAERINSCTISTEATIRELKLQQEVKRLKDGVNELLRIYKFQISAKDLRELIENK